jgi:hypothetical protein
MRVRSGVLIFNACCIYGHTELTGCWRHGDVALFRHIVLWDRCYATGVSLRYRDDECHEITSLLNQKRVRMGVVLILFGNEIMRS